MTARTHDIFAFASLVTVAAYYPPENLNIYTVFASIIAVVIGALIPDIDQASNRLWDLLPLGNTLGKVLRHLFIKHRTISHSLLGFYLFYRISFWVLPLVLNGNYINIQVILISLLLGYLSHLVLDAITKDGLPLFFPLPFKIGIPPIEALRIRTGSGFEKFVFFPATLVYLIWFVGNNQSKLLSLIRLIH